MSEQFAMLDKFPTLSEEELQDVNGGYNRAGARTAGEMTGYMFGGVAAGAAIGSAFPVVGTAAGALLGGIYGTALWGVAQAVKW